MQLHRLLDRLRSAGLPAAEVGPAGAEKHRRTEIDQLADDSRKVGPDALFVAVRGEAADGHLFIDKAVNNGATAVLCEAVPTGAHTRFPGIRFVRTADTRAALAELAAAFYDDPSRELQMIGVTGTNGKTTTAYLTHHLLTTLGMPAALLGTIETRLGAGAVPAPLTTPGSLELHRMLREAVRNGCAACAMEVSSHALAQDRVRAVAYDAAVFTNLTPDHLDYHASFSAYRDAKKKLFDTLSADAAALYNADDPAAAQIVAGTKARLLSFGKGKEADFRIEILENRLSGLRLRLGGRERTFRLVGGFNAYNLAAAYGVGRALGFGEEEMLDALAEAPPVPGRFEQISFAGGPTVIVDYAHTPDALENVLTTIRHAKDAGAALWCVFGCGGDRDPYKRRDMGRLAERLADRVIVTNDNPRTEIPESIMAGIRRGMDRPGEALWIPDRRAAIRAAAERARPGDVVLVAGKGHEPYQIIGTERYSFDDREEVRRSFGSRR